jgi:PBP1b-binding outer membrane lipoprotein LpoB
LINALLMTVFFMTSCSSGEPEASGKASQRPASVSPASPRKSSSVTHEEPSLAEKQRARAMKRVLRRLVQDLEQEITQDSSD